MSCNNKNNVLGANRLSSRVDNFVLNHTSAPVDFPATTDLLESVTQPDDQSGLDNASYTDKKILELESSFDDKYVTLTFANTTYASQDVVYGESSLNIDVNGYTVGYNIFNGTGGDYIKFKTSTFMLVDPSSGTETTPFYYASGKFKFSGDVLIDGNLVVAGSITGGPGGQIGVGTVQDMNLNSISANKILAGTLSAGVIYGGAIYGSQFVAVDTGEGQLATIELSTSDYYGVMAEGQVYAVSGSGQIGIAGIGTSVGVSGVGTGGTTNGTGGDGGSFVSVHNRGIYTRSDNYVGLWAEGAVYPIYAVGTIKATGSINVDRNVVADGDAIIDGDVKAGANYTKGVILKSPNGTSWRITVDDSGNLTTTSL